jgi:Holliday junction resolvasome RuvABC endonuclease subunit
VIALTFDLSRQTGWACGDIRGDRPVMGDIYLPFEGGEGARLAALENEIILLLNAHEPEYIVMESPLSVFAMNNEASARQQLGLRAIALAVAYRESLPVTEVSADIARAAVIGLNRAGSSDAMKKAVMLWCRRQGLRPASHNSGDAAVVWFWYRAVRTGIYPNQLSLAG